MSAATVKASAMASPSSFKAAVREVTSISDVTEQASASGSLGGGGGRRAHKSQSGGSPRERVVRVADNDSVREWTSRPMLKKGIESPSGFNGQAALGKKISFVSTDE